MSQPFANARLLQGTVKPSEAKGFGSNGPCPFVLGRLYTLGWCNLTNEYEGEIIVDWLCTKVPLSLAL